MSTDPSVEITPEPRAGTLAPLRRPAVRRIWLAGVVSDVGTWMQLVVVGTLIARNTGSALQTGLVALATFAPQGLVSPLGGVLADRVDRRKMLACTLTGQTIFTAVLGVLISQGHTAPTLLASVMFVQASIGALGGPAHAAMLPTMVPKHELMSMISLGIASWNSGRILGPILGTLLESLLGPAGAVFANAASFFVLAVVVFMLRRPFPGVRNVDSTLLDEFREGWRVFAHGPHGSFFVLSIVGVSFFVTPFMGFIPIVATEIYGGDTGLSGVFSASQGLGALVGTLLLVPVVRRIGGSMVLRYGVVAMAAGYVIYVNIAVEPLAVVMLATMGLGAASWFSTVQSTLQRDVSPEHRARVMSLSQSTFGVGYGAGLLVLGNLADWLGLARVLSAAAIIGLVWTLIVQFRQPGWRRFLDHKR